jgi:hopanoid biosynthesis associated RND transporter like protein HpnN
MIEAPLVRAACRYPRSVTAVAVLVTALLVVYVAGALRLDTNPDRLLDPNLPYLKTERALNEAFPQMADSIVVVLDGPSAARSEAAARRLISRFKSETKLISSVYAPAESEFFARNGLLYLERPELEALTERLSEAAPYLGALAQDTSLRGLFSIIARSLDEDIPAAQREQLAKMLGTIADTVEAQADGRPQQIAWRDALMGNMGGSAGGARRFIVVQPRFDFARFNYAQDALQAVRRLVTAEREADPTVRIRLTGEVPMDADELESVEKEMTFATLLSLGLVLVLLVIALRSAAIVFGVVVTLVVGLVWTAAFAAFAVGSLNLISASFAVLFIGFGVDFGIQFGLRYREEAAEDSDRNAALARTATGVGPALTLAAATAAVGFFSFTPTSYRGLAELGIIAGASMFFGLLANLTVLPALIKLLPHKTRPLARTSGTLTRTRSLLERRWRVVLYCAAGAAAASALVAPYARFDFNPLNMKDPTTESVAAFIELLRDPGTSPYTIEVLAANVTEAQNVAAKLQKLPVVDKTVTLASFVPEAQQEKLASIQDMGVVLAPLMVAGASGVPPAGTADEARAYTMLREKLMKAGAQRPEDPSARTMLRLASALERLQAMPGWPEKTVPELRQRIVSDLPQQLGDLQRLLQPAAVTVAEVPPDVAARYVAPDGRARIEVFPKEDLTNNDALRRFVREVQAVVPQATGAPVALLEGGDAVVRACMQAAALALAGSFLLLALVLRGVRDVIFVLLPMVLAALLTTAMSVIVDLPFNLANVIALPLLVTMTVAYGIYLVMRERAQKELAELLESSTPRAVLFSALTTAVAFGSMAFSAHRGMSSMGLLLAISLLFALLSTLIVLPALLAARR